MKHIKYLAALIATAFSSTALAQEDGGFDVGGMIESLETQVGPWIANIAGALVGLFVGWIVANWLGGRVRKVVQKRDLDATLGNFFANLVKYLVLTAVILGVLGVFGIETSSFAAIIGAAGLAIGLAFQGTLSHFASGILLLVFRPFNVDDLIEAAGTVGTVMEIGLFTITIKTLDSRRVIIPNGDVAGGKIINIGHYPERRVDIAVGTDYGADLDEVRATLEATVKTIPGVISEPEPQIFLKALGGSSIDWEVRVWCKTPDYWDVYQATILATKNALDAKSIGIPFPQMDVHFDADVAKKLAS